MNDSIYDAYDEYSLECLSLSQFDEPIREHGAEDEENQWN